MYELWELIGDTWTLFARAPSCEAAIDRLDDECRRRCEQLAANGEGASRIRFQFEIRDPSGTVVAGMSTRPSANLRSGREPYDDRIRRLRPRDFGHPDDYMG
jgi:hypothetical protein